MKIDEAKTVAKIIATHAARKAEYQQKLTDGRHLTALERCRLKCMECSNFDLTEIRECNILDCALYPVRMGRYSAEDHQMVTERFRS